MNTLTASPASAAAVSARVDDAIDQIVRRAKIDRAGVYWQPGAAFRSGNSEAIPLSLGYGTPGVLLALLAYHGRSGDRDVAEMLHQGLAWVQHRAKKAEFAHGFALGTPGLWYLYRQCERDLPGVVGTDWRATALQALRAAKPASAASIAAGCAGTIVGTLACFRDECLHDRAMLSAWCERLLGLSAIGEKGVFWDCNITSVQPPLGFLFGNAGVEYTLAHAAVVTGRRCSPVLLGSLARARSAWHEAQANWPDFDGLGELRHADQAGLDRLLDARERESGADEAPEFVLGWSSGASGILLARQALAIACQGSDVARAAEADVRRAVQAVLRGWRPAASASDTSIQQGLAGLLLSLRAVSARADGDDPALQKIAAEIERELGERAPGVQHDDVSLLTGLAGPVYALLCHDGATGTCVDPLGEFDLTNEKSAQEEMPGGLALQLRMPACASAMGADPVVQCAPLDLGVVTAAVDRAGPGLSRAHLATCRHEIGLHGDLSRTNFRAHLWRELAAQRRYAWSFHEGMDDAVLFGRFRLDPSVALLNLDFDPATRAPAPANQSLVVLRQAGSRGVVEIRLSQLQAGLLREFAAGAVAIKVIHDVVDRVQTPNVTQRQLAALALKMVRGFIQGGQIVPVDTNSMGAWLIRRKHGEVRQNLFPASGA